MPVKLLEVKNFRSFRHISLEPGPFHFVVGSNASGKTNFIHTFKFIRDTALYGLSNAVSLQGGAEFLRNVYLQPGIPAEFTIGYDLEEEVPVYIGINEGLPFFLMVRGIRYHLSLSFSDNSARVLIGNEELNISGNFYTGEKIPYYREFPGTLQLRRRGNNLKTIVIPSGDKERRSGSFRRGSWYKCYTQYFWYRYHYVD